MTQPGFQGPFPTWGERERFSRERKTASGLFLGSADNFTNLKGLTITSRLN